MRRLVVAAVAGVVGLVGWAGTPGARAATPAVVAGPGSAEAKSFATPFTVVRPGDAPALVNADINWHGILSEEQGPDDRPWCEPLDPSLPESPANPRRAPIGECPLFAADFATPLGGVVEIAGLEDAAPGRVYSYRCTFVTGMTGTLIVEPTSNPGETS